MKKLFTLLAIISLSCNKEVALIAEDTNLRTLPEHFFTTNKTHHIQSPLKPYTYVTQFGRFSNTEFSKYHLKKHPETYLSYFNVTINLSNQNAITLEGVPILKEELIPYTKDYIDFAAEGKQTMIHLNFDETILLKDYISFIDFIKPMLTEKIVFNSKVFIYDIKALPNCDCTL